MSNSADVRSLEQLDAFLQHCQLVRSELLKEIENLQLELRRLSTWLENDALAHWTTQLQRSQRYLIESQEALVRCRSVVRSNEQRPCTEERKRVALATERRNQCDANCVSHGRLNKSGKRSKPRRPRKCTAAVTWSTSSSQPAFSSSVNNWGDSKLIPACVPERPRETQPNRRAVAPTGTSIRPTFPLQWLRRNLRVRNEKNQA